jgi:hypothetical protein
MHLLVLSQDLIQSFKFWYQNGIHQGMCFNNEMYRLCVVYGSDDRHKAFSLATALIEHGAQACITCLNTEYKVWVSLRTQNLAASVPALAPIMA